MWFWKHFFQRKIKSITSIFANYNKLQLILPKYHNTSSQRGGHFGGHLEFLGTPPALSNYAGDFRSYRHYPTFGYITIYHDMLTYGVPPHLYLSLGCHPTKWFFHVQYSLKLKLTYIYTTKQSTIIIHLIRNLCFHIQIIHLRISVQVITKIFCSIALLGLVSLWNEWVE